ncbi:MAG: twin-arginine translocase TatA/TatE family subunit [Thermodesulfobacteriota bacterium]|jgi:sec-independent protein translocase protein TatA|nr:twin-arginine translocase TatA/TatE family subunit [Thermodesulfobacteriota bacterium]
MFGLGLPEIIIIALIILFLFGAKRLPEIGKGLGGAIGEFKKAKRERNPDKGEVDKKGDKPTSLENKILNSALDKIPEVKKVSEIKQKAEKIKRIID